MTSTVDTLRIDAALASHLVPLSEEEYALLEENILADGCREPLVLWGDVLVDGHNRYRICTTHGIDFDTVQREFADRAEVEDWMDANQLGRRNLTPEATSLLRGRRYNRTKQQGARTDLTYGQSVQKLTTAAKLSEQHGVDEKTIRRDGKFADAVETLKPHIPDIEQRVLSGDVPSKAIIVEAAKTPERAVEMLASTRMAVHYSSDSPEWYTPRHILDAAVVVLGVIDLDPCSNSAESPNVPATSHYTAADDGLAHAWTGRVYLNPPYGDEIGQWTGKLHVEYAAGNVAEAIALVPARTDTKWFRELRDYPRCFVSGRLKFSDSASSAPFPSAVIYFGDNVEAFAAAFAAIGDTYVRHA